MTIVRRFEMSNGWFTCTQRGLGCVFQTSGGSRGEVRGALAPTPDKISVPNSFQSPYKLYLAKRVYFHVFMISNVMGYWLGIEKEVLD